MLVTPWFEETMEPLPSSVRIRLSDVRDKMEWKAGARCGRQEADGVTGSLCGPRG